MGRGSQRDGSQRGRRIEPPADVPTVRSPRGSCSRASSTAGSASRSARAGQTMRMMVRCCEMYAPTMLRICSLMSFGCPCAVSAVIVRPGRSTLLVGRHTHAHEER